jgi:Carbohydrate esterase, sialic acid-specific acetylesterase
MRIGTLKFITVFITGLLLALFISGSITKQSFAQQTQPMAAKILISSPLDLAVFQRQTRTQGTVLIAGKITGNIDGKLEFRLWGKPLEGNLPSGWQQIAVDPSTHTFRQQIPVPAGGWYRLAMQLLLPGSPTPELSATVTEVGVGEVFVISGQSNSTNYGQAPQKITTGLVSSFDGHTWVLANDPQPGVQDRSNKGSFIPAFGDLLAEKFKVPIGIASTGCGSTSVRQWLPKGQTYNLPPTTARASKQIGPHEYESTGELFNGLMTRIKQLGPHGFRALLWHQGESDANQQPGHTITPQEYTKFMTEIIRDSQQQAGWSFPWFVAQATFHNADDPSNPPIRAAQKALWDSGVAQQGPDTDTLGPAYRHGVHFNAKGLQAHGSLWAQKVESYLDKVLGS